MAYISLYRKYRPQTFEEVVGQVHITQTLSNAITEDRVTHAYLFCGPRGTGKTTVAKILAKAVNCSKGPTSKPCNKCPLCKEITGGRSVDVLEIDAASNRGIDEIRNLREKIHFAPTSCRSKVYIVDEVHMLTTEAFNALLKMLEEPPSHVIFILATTEPHKVLPTILSRCQRFDFRRISIPDTVEHLKKVADTEKIAIDESVLPLIAKHAQGSLRDALGTLDQLSSYTAKKIGIDDVFAFLGLIDVDLVFEATDLVLKKDTASALFLVNRLVESGHDLRQFVRELIEHFRNLFVLQNTADSESVIDATKENITRMENQAAHLKSFEAMRFIDILSDTYNEMRYSTDVRLLLEAALVKLTKLEADISLEGLLYRVEELENKGLDSGAKAHPAGRDLDPKTQTQASQQPAPANSGNKTSFKEKPEVVEIKSEEKQEIESAPSPSPGSASVPESVKEAPLASLEKVKRAWTVVLEQVKKKKISTYALLLECQPTSVTDSTLSLEFDRRAAFHKDEIAKPQNVEIIESSLKEILGIEVKISCTVEGTSCDEPQTEVQVPNKITEAESLEKESLSQEAAIKLAQESLGAEVIEEETNDQNT